MKTKLLAALLIAASASFAAPAFASGYGPAPFYRPSVGAPASERGQSAQTVTAERQDADSVSRDSYGGVAGATSAAGSRIAVETARDTYQGH